MDAETTIAPGTETEPIAPLGGPHPSAPGLLEAAQAEEQFLQITLNGNLPLLLPGASLVEIMNLAIGQVMPMFEMPPWVVGIYNWRGDLLWVADLGHFLGFDPWYYQVAATARHTVVVIKPPYAADPAGNEQSPTVGLVVSGVNAMLAYAADAQPPIPNAIADEIAPGLLPFLREGYGDHQLILDSTAVLAAMAQAHS